MAKAPSFELQAAVSGRKVTANEGRPLVLVFHGPKTTDAPKQVGKAVRAVYPRAEDVLVANVVDLRSMGGLWKKVADAGMKATYDKMAGKVDDPVEYVVICPDWDGAVCQAFGVEQPDVEPAVAVLGPDGELRGLHHGKELAEQALAWLGS